MRRGKGAPPLKLVSQFCPRCGFQLERSSNRVKQIWLCPNPDCPVIEIRLSRNPEDYAETIHNIIHVIEPLRVGNNAHNQIRHNH